MQTLDIKQETHQILKNLPDGATWDDLMYKIYVRQAIESGLEDSEAGRTFDISAVRARLGLSE
jgi:hypothetical protein